MRCKGTTKSGARCKRAAAGDKEYCSKHVDQALGVNAEPKASTGQETKDSKPKEKSKKTAEGEAKPNDSDTIFGESEAKPSDEDWLDDCVDTLVDAAMVGAVVVAALTVGRFLRVF